MMAERALGAADGVLWAHGGRDRGRSERGHRRQGV